MKIQVLSDLHLEFAPWDPPRLDVDMVILAGDTHVNTRGPEWAIAKFSPDIPIIYIAGNHEFYASAIPREIDKLRAVCARTNVHFLECDAFEYREVTVLGCCLWSDFSLYGEPALAKLTAEAQLNDFRQIRISPSFSRLTSQYVAGLHRRSVAWLTDQLERRQGETIIIVTHYSPSSRSIHPQYGTTDPLNAAFACDLDSLVEKSGARYWIHGHMHNSARYVIDKTIVVCNPRGYSPHDLNPDFVPDLIVEV